MLRWVGPIIAIYTCYAAYLDRHKVLGKQGRWQLARRFAEIGIGVFAIAIFGRAADEPSVRAGSPWNRLALLIPTFYRFALSVTGLLHVIHLLVGKIGEPYRIGWVLSWMATVSL